MMPQNKRAEFSKAANQGPHGCVLCCFVFSAAAIVILGCLAFLVWNQAKFIDGMSPATIADPSNSVGSLMGAVGVYGVFFVYCAYSIASVNKGTSEETASVSSGAPRSYGMVPTSEAALAK